MSDNRNFAHIYFNIVLPFTPRSSEWSLYLRYSYYKSQNKFLSTPCMLNVMPVFLDVITLIILDLLEEEKITKLYLCNFFHDILIPYLAPTISVSPLCERQNSSVTFNNGYNYIPVVLLLKLEVFRFKTGKIKGS
jgi:hypothetical protein